MIANKRKYARSIAWKIIITCLFAGSTIFLSLYVSNFTFKRILYTVNELSKPNNRIQLVNDIFRDVVTLDQLQRNEDFKDIHNDTDIFVSQYTEVQYKLDSLRAMSLQNKVQVLRIDSMKNLVGQKKDLFDRYIQLRASLSKSDTLSRQVKKLSGLIEKAGLRLDSNLVTSSRNTEIIIDTLTPVQKKQNLWRRIFPKKKKQEAKIVEKKIQQELHTRIDTLAAAHGGKSVAEMSRAISVAEKNRTESKNMIVSRQVAINQVNDVLLGQLIKILDDVEADELLHASAKNGEANAIVNTAVENISFILLFFIAGTAVLIYMIFTDIARSNTYRNQLIAARDEAEEAGRVKQRFLANMSHELRTPLQAIVGISEQMRLNEQATPREVENIYHSSQHLLQTVNEILDYSRIISGRYTLDSSAFSVSQVIEEVKEMIQVHATMKQLQLRLNVAVKPGEYYIGDPFRLKQVLLNLLGNAVKYTEKGTVHLSVTYRDRAADTLFTFTIKDTGIGMAEEDVKIIFNEFEQVNNPYKQNGTGLGLNIVKTLIELQQGHIKVQSIPGKGSVFVAELPFVKTTPPAKAVQAAKAGTSSYTGHVWVADDDAYILELCDSILNKHGISHTCFSAPLAALQSPVPANLTVVFLDIRMPGMSGMELCGKLKAKITTNLPVFVALTAQVLPQEQDGMRAKGFDQLLLKPFMEESFINIIYSAGQAGRAALPAAINPATLKKMTGEDPAVMKKMLGTFVRETEKDIKTARYMLACGDTAMLAEPVHKLAGRCGQFGATAMAQQLRSLEIKLRSDGATDAIAREVQAALAILQQLADEIKAA